MERMGLELVEIVMQAEETFGVVVSDDEALEITTVGQFHQYILDLRQQQRRQKCPTARAFREVRSVLMETTSAPKQAIRPATELERLLPVRARRRVWKRLEQEASGRTPGLRLPCRLGPALAGLCVIGGFAGTAIILPHVGIVHAIVLGGATTAATLLLVFFITRPFAVAFPHGVVTVGDLATATFPPGHEASLRQDMTDQEVWERLQEIVAGVIGLKVEDITPSARFVEDLGAG
jgi:acyl carrier protein